MFKYDKFDLTGKVAICAGGSSGLGYQFARALASAGADVALVARRVDRLEENAAAISKDYGVKAYAHYMDLTKPETITTAVEDVLKEFGRIDILCNSAGVPCRNVAEECSYEDWMLVLDSDLNGPFWLMHEVVRLAMKPQMYGDMNAFVEELRGMGFAEVQYVETAEKIFGSQPHRLQYQRLLRGQGRPA